MSEIGHDASASVLQRVRAVNVGLSIVRRRGARAGGRGGRRRLAPAGRRRRRGRGAAGAGVGRARRARRGRPTRRRCARSRARARTCVTVAPAGEVIEGLEGRMLLHAGPPIDVGARVRPAAPRAGRGVPARGLGRRSRTARRRCWTPARSRLRRGNEHGHVGPMTGVCSPSMPVWVVQDEGTGARAFSTLNEGPGRTLWFGVGDDEAVERARFLRDRAGPLLARLLERTRADRRPRPRRPGAADGRRAAHAQPGDDEPALAPAAAGLRRRGRGGRRRASLAGNHHFFLNLVDGGGEVRVAGGRRARPARRSSR